MKPNLSKLDWVLVTAFPGVGAGVAWTVDQDAAPDWSTAIVWAVASSIMAVWYHRINVSRDEIRGPKK